MKQRCSARTSLWRKAPHLPPALHRPPTPGWSTHRNASTTRLWHARWQSSRKHIQANSWIAPARPSFVCSAWCMPGSRTRHSPALNVFPGNVACRNASILKLLKQRRTASFAPKRNSSAQHCSTTCPQSALTPRSSMSRGCKHGNAFSTQPHCARVRILQCSRPLMQTFVRCAHKLGSLGTGSAMCPPRKCSSIATLVEEQSFSMDEALHDLTHVRGDISRFLQARARMPKAPQSPHTPYTPPGPPKDPKGPRKGEGKGGKPASPNRQQRTIDKD